MVAYVVFARIRVWRGVDGIEVLKHALRHICGNGFDTGFLPWIWNYQPLLQGEMPGRIVDVTVSCHSKVSQDFA